MKPWGCLVLLAVAAAQGGCSEASSADRYVQDPAAVARGKALFTGTCGAYCHSTRKDNRDAPYLFDCQWRHGGSDAEIFRTISAGVPQTRMIGFGGKLPDGDEDIWKLVAYLKAGRERC